MLHAPDAAAAFQMLYGVIVQDSRVTVLLSRPLWPQDITRQGIEAFLAVAHPDCGLDSAR